MDAIDKIIQEINREALKERQMFEINSIKKIEEKYAAELKLKETQLNQKKENEINRIESDIRQQEGKLKNLFNQKNLTIMQQLLSQLYDESFQKIIGWDKDEHRDFFLKTIKNFRFSGVIYMTPGKKMTEILDSEWTKQVSRTLVYDLSVNEPHNEKKYGFELVDRGVHYNFFYDDLLLEDKKVNGGYVMHKLFD